MPGARRVRKGQTGKRAVTQVNKDARRGGGEQHRGSGSKPVDFQESPPPMQTKGRVLRYNT